MAKTLRVDFIRSKANSSAKLHNRGHKIKNQRNMFFNIQERRGLVIIFL